MNLYSWGEDSVSPPCCHPPVTPSLPSPRRTFCDKCRGRAAWLSYPPAAAPPGRSRTRRRPWSARRLRGEGSGETVAPCLDRGGVRPTTGFPPSWVLPALQKTTSVSPVLAGQDISPGRVPPARHGVVSNTGTGTRHKRSPGESSKDKARRASRGRQLERSPLGKPAAPACPSVPPALPAPLPL